MSGWQQKGRALTARLYEGSRQPRWAMASQMVTSGTNFATTLIIVRSLGFEEFGRFSVCFLSMMMARNFLNGLVLTPMSTIAPKLSDRAQADYRGFLAANAMAFSVGSSVLLYALAVPLGVLLDAPWLSGLALAMALANFTANGADFIRRYHFVQNAPVRAFAVDAIRFAAQLGLLLGLAFYWRESFSAATALYALAAGGLVGLVVGMPHYGITRWSGRLSSAVWPRHRNFIGWMTPVAVIESVQTSGVLLIGGLIVGEAALGAIRAIENLANVLNLPFNALQQVTPSMAARLLKRGKVQSVYRLLASLSSASLMFILIITIAMSLNFKSISLFLFTSYSDEYFSVFLIFCAVNAMATIRYPLTVILQIMERPGALVITGIFSAALAVAGALILPVDFGSTGLAVARLLGVSVSIVLLITAVRRIGFPLAKAAP